MSIQIQKRVNETLGHAVVNGIEFRVVPPRRYPQRAAHSSGEFQLEDEADRIPDPLMRGIYRAARRKARA